MQNYFTNINLVNGKFVGLVFNSNNNLEVFKTKEYEHQSQALQEINEYLQTNIQPTTNRIVQTTVPNRKCCGG